jgi:carbon storage regulator
MLVLSRHKDQEVVITVGDQQIVATVVEIRGDKVRIGFKADKSVTIHRREVHEAIEREKELAQG